MKSSAPCPWRTEGSSWMSYLRSASVNANSVCLWQTFSSSSSLEWLCPLLPSSPASSWPPWCTASKGVLPARMMMRMKMTLRTELHQNPSFPSVYQLPDHQPKSMRGGKIRVKALNMAWSHNVWGSLLLVTGRRGRPGAVPSSCTVPCCNHTRLMSMVLNQTLHLSLKIEGKRGEKPKNKKFQCFKKWVFRLSCWNADFHQCLKLVLDTPWKCLDEWTWFRLKIQKQFKIASFLDLNTGRDSTKTHTKCN